MRKKEELVVAEQGRRRMTVVRVKNEGVVEEVSWSEITEWVESGELE